MTVISGEENIKAFRILTMRSALRLEVKGMKASRNVNAYMLAKKEFGFKGNKQKVLDQLNTWIEENIKIEG